MMPVKQHPGVDTYTERKDDDNSCSDESESSEIERLGTATPIGYNESLPAETPTERGIAKTKSTEELILKIIAQSKALGSNTLDLGGKGVRRIPEEMLELSQLEVNRR